MPNKTRKTRRRQSKKQRVWKMKGCSSKRRSKRGGCGKCLGGANLPVQTGGVCPCAAGLLMGGKKRKSCGCGNPFFNGGVKQSGGQPALVGSSWSPSNTSTWGTTNHLSLNSQTNNPNYSPTLPIENRLNETVPPHSAFSKQAGGRKKTPMKGGGFNIFPQDLVNLGRGASFHLGSAYNAFVGYPAPVNPMPFKDQMVNTKYSGK